MTDLETEIDILTANICRTRDVTIVSKRMKMNHEKLTEEIEEMISNKNHIRKRWQRNRHGDNRIRLLDISRAINNAIGEHRNKE